MTRALICPPDRRGHTWRVPEPALLHDHVLPQHPAARRDLAALRVCRRCGTIGRVSAQGIVIATTPAEAKTL